MTNEIKYLSIKQILENDRFPFTNGQLRFYLNKRHLNGLDKAIRKIGKRIYIREDYLYEWIEKQAGK
jgi:hypothetical protein